MTKNSVCAVIITYHPAAHMIDNLATILSQVQSMVVVDNGSDVETVLSLRAASKERGFILIENLQNLGIAKALNQGVQLAKANNHSWVLLFDQDSKITEGFLDNMFASWEAHPSRQLIGSIHPRYVDPSTGTEPRVRRASDGGPVVSITSGALMPVWIFDRVGPFASEYFIDMVDHEYSFRIRAAGYLVADSREATLLHSAGHPTSMSFLGFSFKPSNHSATRRYYISRNRIAFFKRYIRIFPVWVLHSVYESFRETIKCLLAEQNRTRKFQNFLLGTWDGLVGRMGEREGI